MAKLPTESRARLLGDGMCIRPAELECRMESACETCAYLQTGAEFIAVVIRQRDHARQHNQPDRAALFDGLISTNLVLDQHDHFAPSSHLSVRSTSISP